MKFSPVLPEYFVTYSNIANLYHLTGRVIGHIWRMISQMPNPLYQLVLLIKTVAARCWQSDSNSSDQSDEGEKTPLQPLCPRWKRLRDDDPFLNSMDCFLHGIYKSPKNSRVPLKEPKEENVSPSNKKDDVSSLSIDQEVKVEHDPLDKMGTITLLDSSDDDTLISQIISPRVIDNEILQSIQEMIQPAQDLLIEIDKKKKINWQDILELLEQLEQELEPLKAYASTFETIPKGHRLIQDTMKTLEDKTRAYGRELCVQIKEQYKPNYLIKKDGHCLFWSIEDLLKKNEQPVYYRRLAADYIRKHAEEFESGVADAAKSIQGRAKISEYAKAQKGRQAWFDKLEKKMGRRPTRVDFYCDCLENSNLWGGTNEIMALSEELEVPILIFSRQDNKTWRFDMIKGFSKFKNKTPLLLYYNGINHYQSLIPIAIKKSAKN